MGSRILPLAITMMAGPQIMSAFILVTGSRAVKASLAFLAGVLLAATLGVTIAMLLASFFDLGDPKDSGSTGAIIQYILIGLLIIGAVRQYLGRRTAKPPKWLGVLQSADARKAFTTGFLIILLMPSDIMVMLTVGVNLSQHRESLAGAIPFLALTLLIAALPLLAYLLFHGWAERTMPLVRDWMNTHSWLVNIFVYAIFVVIILTG